MPNLARRGFLIGLASTVIVAPAIVRASNIMPVKVIKPTIHTIKLDYTVELAQDLKSYHGIDAERELTDILAQEMIDVQRKNWEDAGIIGPSVEKFDPVLISLVRRHMPNLIAYDLCGVSPMTGPSEQVFALRRKYATS